MNSTAPVAQTAPKAKKNGLKLVLSGFVCIVIALALGLIGHELYASRTAANAAQAQPRASTAILYSQIPLPTELQLREHQTVTGGTPSEVYFYSYSGEKLAVSNDFIASLKRVGYSVTAGNDGLIFSASKDGSINLNFTFSDPNQLKVVAI